MKIFAAILISLLIASAAGAKTPAQISADLTADFITACQQGPDAFANFEQCIAGATIARDAAVKTQVAINECLTLPTAKAQDSCLQNINK